MSLISIGKALSILANWLCADKIVQETIQQRSTGYHRQPLL